MWPLLLSVALAQSSGTPPAASSSPGGVVVAEEVTEAAAELAVDAGVLEPVDVAGLGALAWGIAAVTSRGLKTARVRRRTRRVVVPLVGAGVAAAAAVALTGALGPAALAAAGAALLIAKLVHAAERRHDAATT